MKRRQFLRLCCAVWAVGGLLGSGRPLLAQEAPADMQLFLLIGQSNMAGRGNVEAQDKETNPRIWMLTKDLTWTLAKDPLHFDKSVAGVGLGSEFARTLAQAEPQISIGLIPSAVGGTSLDQWKVGSELYTQAVARAREAMKKGTLKGILWHQGEADRKPDKVATYPARFSAMIAQLRLDLDAPDVPVLVGELGRFRSDQDPFNAMLPEVARIVPNSVIVTAEELKDKGDNLHFDSASLRTFGQRYAQAYLQLQEKPAAAK